VPSDRPARERPDPIAFSAAEKLAAEWEARHDVAAVGRRSTGLGVAQYMAHERCTEACTPSGHAQARRHNPAGEASRAEASGEAEVHRPPRPDPHPHASDLWGWLLPKSGDRPDERRGGHRA
jgi:hypothetical protein